MMAKLEQFDLVYRTISPIVSSVFGDVAFVVGVVDDRLFDGALRVEGQEDEHEAHGDCKIWDM